MLAATKTHKLATFACSETEHVISDLQGILVGFQQEVCKKFARLLIKRICPRKTYRWPYIGNTRPPFWPEDVNHVEPHSLRWEQRVKLLIHLCRLRPNPEKQAFWAQEQDRSLERSGPVPETSWTSLVESCLSPEVLREVFKGNAERIARAVTMRERFIELLRNEENSLNDNVRDLHTHHPRDRIEETLIRGKRKAEDEHTNTDDNKVRKLAFSDNAFTGATLSMQSQALPTALGTSLPQLVASADDGNFAGTFDDLDPLRVARLDFPGFNSHQAGAFTHSATTCCPPVESDSRFFDPSPTKTGCGCYVCRPYGGIADYVTASVMPVEMMLSGHNLMHHQVPITNPQNFSAAPHLFTTLATTTGTVWLNPVAVPSSTSTPADMRFDYQSDTPCDQFQASVVPGHVQLQVHHQECDPQDGHYTAQHQHNLAISVQTQDHTSHDQAQGAFQST